MMIDNEQKESQDKSVDGYISSFYLSYMRVKISVLYFILDIVRNNFKHGFYDISIYENGHIDILIE